MYNLDENLKEREKVQGNRKDGGDRNNSRN